MKAIVWLVARLMSLGGLRDDVTLTVPFDSDCSII